MKIWPWSFLIEWWAVDLAGSMEFNAILLDAARFKLAFVSQGVEDCQVLSGETPGSSFNTSGHLKIIGAPPAGHPSSIQDQPWIHMDQYLLIPFLVGWTSIYQLFWCSPGVQGFDTLPCGSEARPWSLSSGSRPGRSSRLSTLSPVSGPRLDGVHPQNVGNHKSGKK